MSPSSCIEDDATMARLVRHLLEIEGYTRIKHVWSAELALDAAAEADIILLDHQLPDVRGIDLLPQLLSRPEPPSVIMVTGHGSESLAAAALRLGAEDYLTKDHTLPELLPRIIERVRRNRALRRALGGCRAGTGASRTAGGGGRAECHPAPRAQQSADGGERRGRAGSWRIQRCLSSIAKACRLRSPRSRSWPSGCARPPRSAAPTRGLPRRAPDDLPQ